MQKQLNPDLFGNESNLGFVTADRNTSNSASFDHILNLDNKMAELRMQLNQIKDVVGQLKADQQITHKSNQGQVEQILRAIKILEQNDQTLAQQNQMKNQHLSQKLADYKNIEVKLKEMMDRHQMVLRSYDLKIQQLQQLMHDKENLIVSFQGSLQEARNEIARLKRA